MSTAATPGTPGADSAEPVPAASGPGDQDLSLGRLYATVGVHLALTIETWVPSTADLATVATDIVACWQHLPAEALRTYTSDPHRVGVLRLADDYIELINEHLDPPADYQPPPAPHRAEDHLRRYLWRQRLTDISLVHAGKPPSPDWIAAFPIPTDQRI